MRFRILLCLAGLLLITACSQASALSVVIDDRGSALTLLESRDESLHFSVRVGLLTIENVETDAGVFARLAIPGFHVSQRPGEPELPQVNRLFEAPLGARIDIEILSVSTRIIDLADLGILNPVFPSQPHRPKRNDYLPSAFRFDGGLYLGDAWLGSELVRVEEMGRLRAARVARADIGLVRYNPVQGTLEVIEEIEFKLDFSGGDQLRETELKAAVASPFFDCVYGRLAGARTPEPSIGRSDLVADKVTMVIVTPPEFENQLQDFTAWKKRRGFNVVVGVTGSPEVGSTAMQIRSYLHDLYLAGTEAEPAPSFVLLLGDIELLPTFHDSDYVTDRPYCSVDGDALPEMYYGRLSASNPTQLQAILDKSLMYEQFAMPDPAYLEEVVLIAGMDEDFGTTHANVQVEYGSSNYFNAEHGILNHSYLYPTSGDNAAEIIADVSAGVSLVNYTAHGSMISWDDPYFGQNNVNMLANAGEYCLAIGNCCDTAAFDIGECFGETWLRVSGKGAIGYVGATGDSYWDDDFWWSIGSCAISPNPEYETTGLGAYDGLFHDHDEPLSDWYVTNDAFIFCGNLAVTEAGGYSSHYWNVYHLLGDPSLSTWIGLPGVNDVSFSILSAHSDQYVRVVAAPGSFVGITLDNRIVGSGRIDADGVSAIRLSDYGVSGEGEIVVMNQFLEPFISVIYLGDTGAPEIQVTPESILLDLVPDSNRELQIDVTNSGEEGSTLYYSVYVNNTESGDRDISGSTLNTVPNEYVPLETITYELIVYNNSSDYEWLSGVVLDFPPGINVIASTNFDGGELGDLVTNHGSGDGATVIWSDPNGSWGNIYGNSSASASITLEFTGGAMGNLLIPFTIYGDGYGDNPHYVSDYMLISGPMGPSVTLIAPLGGEQWPIGEEREIIWSVGGGVNFVNVELSRNFGDDWEMLAKGVSTMNGSYSWTVTAPFSNDCLIRVRSIAGDAEAESNVPFMIYEPLTWLTIPSGSGQCAQGETDQIPLMFDATGLEEGEYNTLITVNSNAGEDITIPVTLRVVGTTDLDEAPPVTRLAGNWPNPFNPSTVITFSLAEQGIARLDIFDVTGRLVRELVAGSLPAGDHSATWDGRDDDGYPVASGLYLYRLDTGGAAQTRKMVLAK
ncbi:MAG: T9SS type A sorting domain-containing protein [bacterium]|nr:T9SS type A sorting domain-containing protein [bacterium]